MTDPGKQESEEDGNAVPPRLLPWPGEDGKPCLLVPDGRGGHVSRLADDMEAEQLATGAEVLEYARKLLDDLMSPYAEVRYAGIRLAECLHDALRIAESRGVRLPGVPDVGGDARPGADGIHRAARAEQSGRRPGRGGRRPDRVPGPDGAP